MRTPRSRAGFELYELARAIPFGLSFEHSASPAGESWRIANSGCVGPGFSIGVIKSCCPGGTMCVQENRFDADFFLWTDALDRVVVVYFDGDITIFEPITIGAAARFIREVRKAPDALKQCVGRRAV